MQKLMLKNKRKKGLSEIVSYVLLIVIALSLAGGVYGWMKYMLPHDNYKCPDDVAISINEYNCSQGTLYLNITNSGMFNVDGFFIRASNETNKIPTLMLNSKVLFDQTTSEGTIYGLDGRYQFSSASPFNVSSIKNVSFNYAPYKTLKKVQIQPYSINSSKLYMCNNIVTIELANCEVVSDF